MIDKDHRSQIQRRGENRGGSEGTTQKPVSRETAAPLPLHSSGDAAVSGNASAGARQPSADGNLYAFGWVLRRIAAIGLAALDSVSTSDPDGDVRDAVKPFLDALRWEGVKLTSGKPETD